jgi:YgiT-type zinc finger domain-containing protein
MIGELENNICPTCGGHLSPDMATIPFLLGRNAVVVVKGVPAEVCRNCHEPFVAGKATDRILALLRQLKALHSEVSVLAYSELMVA